MKNKAIRPGDVQTKPASGPTETRGLEELPSLLLTQVESQQTAQTQQVPEVQQGSEGGGASEPSSG